MTQHDEEYLEALIEDMDDRFDMILDVLSIMRDLPIEMQDVVASLARIERALGTNPQ